MPAIQPMLCRYHYDPLDRLAGRSPDGQLHQCFYQQNRLATEIKGQIGYSWLQTPDYLLAQHIREAGTNDCVLMTTDLPGSVMHGVAALEQQPYVYTPYGTRDPVQDPLQLPGFNRERLDLVTGHYLLGNGYRAFNPVLMRFNSPDSLSPFGKGGLNAYAYCAGDPVNRVDSTGHLFNPLKYAWKWLNEPPPTTRLTLIDKGLFAFDKASKNGRALAIMGHGDPNIQQGYHLIGTADGRRLTPRELLHKTALAGIDFKQYDRVCLMMCHSATGGENSFAAKFSTLVRKPVKGYMNTANVNTEPLDLMKLIKTDSYRVRQLSEHTYQFRGEIKINKTSPYFFLHPEHASFTHQPVTFRNYSRHYEMV